MSPVPFTRIRWLAAVALLGMSSCLFLAPASAALLVTVSQVGDDVVFSGGGSLEIPTVATTPSGPLGGQILPDAPLWLVGESAPSDVYGTFGGGPASFGPGSDIVAADLDTGDVFGLSYDARVPLGGTPNFGLVVPTGHTSDRILSGTSIYVGATYGSLGLTPGTYTWTYLVSGDFENPVVDTLTLTIDPVAVPEPASAALLVLGGTLLLAWRRRVARKSVESGHRRRGPARGVVLAAAVLLAAAPAHGQSTIVYTGDSPVVNPRFFGDSRNWSPGRVPSGNDLVVIERSIINPGGLRIFDGTSVQRLRFGGNASMILMPEGTLSAQDVTIGATNSGNVGGTFTTVRLLNFDGDATLDTGQLYIAAQIDRLNFITLPQHGARLTVEDGATLIAGGSSAIGQGNGFSGGLEASGGSHVRFDGLSLAANGASGAINLIGGSTFFANLVRGGEGSGALIFSLTGGSTGEVRELDLARSNRIDQTPAPDRLTLNTGSSLAVGNGLYGATTTDPNPGNARFNVQVLNGSTLAHSTLDSTQGSQATFNATTVVEVRSAVLDTLGRSVLSAERLVSGSGSFTIGAGGTVRSDSTELSQSSSLSPRGFTEVLAGGTADFGTLDLNDVSLLRINGGDVTANDVTIRSETSGVLVGIELLSGSFRADNVRLDSLLRLVGGTFSAESIQVTRGVGNLRWFDTDVTIRNAGQMDFIGSPGLFGNDECVPTGGSLTYEGALTHQDDLSVLGRLVAEEGITNVGTLQVFGGSIDGGTGGIDNFTRITLDEGKIDGTLRTFGNSSVDVTGASRLTGDVTGRGRFTGSGDAIFSGTLAPGDDLGMATIHFTGNVEIDATGTVVFDLFNLSNHDRLAIDGVLTLSGDLRVSLFGDYQPTVGDRFDLVDAGEILVGADAGFVLPTLNAGLVWDTSAFATSGSLTVAAIPEPGTLALLALGGTWLLARRLRSRASTGSRPGAVAHRDERSTKALRATLPGGPLVLLACWAALGASPLRADVFGSGANQFPLDFVTIGNPGNPADRGTTGSFFAPSGAVATTFRIGTFEVSRANVLAANAPVAGKIENLRCEM